jgi:hypothetical protein
MPRGEPKPETAAPSRSGANRQLIVWPELTNDQIDGIVRHVIVNPDGENSHGADMYLRKRPSGTLLTLSGHGTLMTIEHFLGYSNAVAAHLGFHALRMGIGKDGFRLSASAPFEPDDSRRTYLLKLMKIDVDDEQATAAFDVNPTLLLPANAFGGEPGEQRRNFSDAVFNKLGPRLGPAIMPLTMLSLKPGESSLFPANVTESVYRSGTRYPTV